MRIPNQVKIRGRMVCVTESPRGYVIVGGSLEEINQELQMSLNQLDGTEHIIEWQKAMYNVFERALKKERYKRSLQKD